MLAENKNLKSLASRGVSSVETEIQDLWDELMQLKKENAQWRLRNQALRAQGNASKSPKGRVR